MRIKFSTDSTADIPVSLREELDITVLGFPILANGKEYKDGYDFTPLEFYDILEASDKLPTTAQANPYVFGKLFESVWKEGYTDLIHTSLNSKASATCQNAFLARDQFYAEHPEAKGRFRIHIIDSLTYSMAYGMGVIQAAHMARSGANADEAAAFIQDWVDHVRILVVPANLKYVRKSGRLTGAAAVVGDAIGLKPIITFEEGESKTIAKIRGKKKAIHELVNLCKADRKPGTPYAIAISRDTAEMDLYRSTLIAELNQAPALEFYLGCAITINIGPDVIGIVYRV